MGQITLGNKQLLISLGDDDWKSETMADNSGRSSASDMLRAFHSGHRKAEKTITIAYEEESSIVLLILYKEKENV